MMNIAQRHASILISTSLDTSFNSSTQNEFRAIYSLKHQGLNKIRTIYRDFIGHPEQIPEGRILNFSDTELYFFIISQKKLLVFYKLDYSKEGLTDEAEQVGEAIPLTISDFEDSLSADLNPRILAYRKIELMNIEERIVKFSVEAELFEFGDQNEIETHIFYLEIPESEIDEIRVVRGHRLTEILGLEV